MLGLRKEVPGGLLSVPFNFAASYYSSGSKTTAAFSMVMLELEGVDQGTRKCRANPGLFDWCHGILAFCVTPQRMNDSRSTCQSQGR